MRLTNCIKYNVLIIIFLSPLFSVAQSNGALYYNLESRTTFSAIDKLPFWLRVGKQGNIPSPGISSGIIGSIYKDYDNDIDNLFNWSAGVQLSVSAGKKNNLSLIEGYVNAKKGIFEASVGRMRDFSGLVDSTLSSGSFSLSGNALGIPKVSIGIPEYYGLPYFDKLFALKINYQFGYFGDQQMTTASFVSNASAFYQANSVYLRLGKPDWKLKLFGGINHEVMSGSEKKIFGPDWGLSPVKSLIYAAIGKTYKIPNSDYSASKVGNHIGSIDLGLQYEFESVRLFLYRQNLYDVGAISRLANIEDGINGLSLTNKEFVKGDDGWHKLVFEIIYTRNQAGATGSKITNSGDEDYYNNYAYTRGWSYKGENLGNPLLTTSNYLRNNLAIFNGDYFVNNRVLAFYTGFDGSISNVDFTVKAAYSNNYGTYGTSAEGHNLAYFIGKTVPPAGLFGMVEQFSGYMEVSKSFNNNLFICVSGAIDMGGLYYNNTGVQLRLKKTFY